jgi:hypothetical protein
MEVFERFLGPSSLECLEAPFVPWHVVLLIYSGGIRLISSKVIVPFTYLRSWALVIIVIVSRFLLDSCPFLLEAIGVNGLGPFLFQAHIRLMQELLPP